MNQEQARAALKKYFGYDDFRPLQANIIQHVYDGKDGIVLMPTGGGKSMCFQIPAVTMTGTTVVVSPLISLMKDQVDGMRAVGIRAAFLNSSQLGSEAHQVEQDYENGELHLLYVSPEKLLSPGFFTFLKRRRVCLFAIDEAHCISAWGHDFRPEYTRLSWIKESFPDTPILALTATADRLTRQDMAKQLGIPDAEQFIASFNRPNLSLEVRPGQKRREQIVRFINERPTEAGIVYCLSRKQTENLAGKLREAGYNAEAYHAGLPAQERADVQSDFINDKTLIVCATVAFGMGIDKSNVRWVIHYTMPKNLENYYQEIGRAGRDGAKADTLLFYSYNDYMQLKDMLGGNPNSEIQLAKLDRMKEFAESLACRRRILLNYFSEDHSENCGNCDICANPPERFDGTTLAQMALSAVARLRESVGSTTVIDVLRGSGRKELVERGYDRIKTFGAGRTHSLADWSSYLRQLINLGYAYIAHEDHNKLRLAPAARRVLFEGESVELVNFKTKQARTKDEQSKTGKRAAAPRSKGELFDILRGVRTELARAGGIPPYLVFSDKTLQEMAAAAPTDERGMRQISGVGEVKLERFGSDFLTAIKKFRAEHPDRFKGKTAAATSAPASLADLRTASRREVKAARATASTSKGRKATDNGGSESYLASYRSYQGGAQVRAIAADRGLTVATILGHLARAYQEGHDFEIEDLIPGGVMDCIDEAIQANGGDTEAKKEILQYIVKNHRGVVVNYSHIALVNAYRSRHPLTTV